MTYFTTGVTAGIEQWQRRFRRLWPGIFRLCEALRSNLRRPPQLDPAWRCPAAFPAAPGPALLYRGHGPIVVRALYRLDGCGVQRRQWPLAAELLQRSRKPRRGRNLEALLSEQRSARHPGHRRQHADRCRKRRVWDVVPGVSAPPPDPRQRSQASATP